ncbi:MAG: CRISPR-associated helicase Cas3' [Chloroflexota bacterium]
MVDYYAHSVGTDKRDWQTLRDHLSEVARLSGDFAAPFGGTTYGRAAGFLHDLGKYSAEFQRRLDGAPLRVDHSTAGAQEAQRLYGEAIGTLISYVVAGHHAGLPDYGTVADEASLAARLARGDLPDYHAYGQDQLPFPSRAELALPVRPLQSQPYFSVQFFARMLYSCLVDADFLDTERALDAGKHAKRSGYPEIETLRDRLELYLDSKFAGAPDTAVNRERAAILRASRERAADEPGLFSLTVPTGGGKTLSSLAFALHHAARHGLRRVIYAIPFTSIIEQNADVFRAALGDEAVVEHHSNFQHPREGDEDWNEESARLSLATENWDAPLIVTTNVQFFESLFANRSSRCRKLHNLVRSVIILDEAQMIPTDLLRPCLAALWELVQNYGATVVLCTATQPALKGLLPPGSQVREIAPDPPRLFEVLRRTRVARLGAYDDDTLAARIADERQALCIVNTRAHARDLYSLLRDKCEAIHLSARMCPRHRAEVLSTVRQALKNDSPCRVVSTQLIEAGVDVDFPVVFRAATGLDSLAQAAGRCNREGLLSCGQVFLFEPVGRPLRGWFQRTATVAQMVLREGGDPLAPETIERYFVDLYDLEGGGLDKQGILGAIAEDGRLLHFPFADIGHRFRLIDSDMMPVVVPWDQQAADLVQAAHYAPSYSLLRKLQPYTVQVYPFEFLALQKSRLVEVKGGIMPVLTDLSCYDKEVGLQPPSGVGTAGEALIY